MFLEISKTECDQVHGGHGAGKIALILSIPHVIELYNISAEFWNEGCQNLDERSYFAQHTCALYNRIRSTFISNDGTHEE